MRRPHRRRRIILLAVAAVAALSLAGWGTTQLIDVFTGGEDKAVAGGRKPGCKPSASPTPKAPAKHAKGLPAPSAVQVAVYNATGRSGLAKQVAGELKERGFQIVRFGNAPKEYDKKVKGTGLLIGAPASLGTHLPVLATQLKGAEKKADARGGAEVDLIIGDGFKSLDAKKDADRALAALTTGPAPTPSSGNGC